MLQTEEQKRESKQQTQIHLILKKAQTYVKLQGPFLGQTTISVWILPKFDGIEFQADTSSELSDTFICNIYSIW